MLLNAVWWLLCSAFLGCTLLPNAWSRSEGNTGFYADNELEQSVMVSPLTRRQKKEIEQEILTLLNLHHKPKPRAMGKETSAPRFMLDLYNKLHGSGASGSSMDGHDPYPNFHSDTLETQMPQLNSSDVIMSFVNHVHKIHFLRHERDRTFYFDFGEVSPLETVTGAELRLYRTKSKHSQRSYRIEVYMIKQGQDLEDKILMPETNYTLTPDYEGWVLMNVTHSAESWTIFPTSNMGLFLKVIDLSSGKEVGPDRAGIVGRKGEPDKQAFLVCFFKMSQQLHIRRTRSTHPQMDSRTAVSRREDHHWSWRRTRRYVRPVCRRKTMHVDFRDLGWRTWIIAPEGYSAYYCDGECIFPLGLNMNATNHAIVQLLVHTVKSQGIPKPCCAPTELSGISVLYFDDNANVILKKYRNMIVQACGCH